MTEEFEINGSKFRIYTQSGLSGGKHQRYDFRYVNGADDVSNEYFHQQIVLALNITARRPVYALRYAVRHYEIINGVAQLRPIGRLEP